MAVNSMHLQGHLLDPPDEPLELHVGILDKVPVFVSDMKTCWAQGVQNPSKTLGRPEHYSQPCV